MRKSRKYLDSWFHAFKRCQHSSSFQKILAKQGLAFKLGTKVTGVKTVKKGNTVNTTEHAVAIDDGKTKSELKANVVLVSIGRKPFTENLGLKVLYPIWRS